MPDPDGPIVARRLTDFFDPISDCRRCGSNACRQSAIAIGNIMMPNTLTAGVDIKPGLSRGR
jgi:hypothetical protein